MALVDWVTPLTRTSPLSRMKQSQHLGRSISDVFMRLMHWLAFRLPTFTWIGNRLIRPRFIFNPHRQSHFFSLSIGCLDQLFLGVASGSLTITTPRFRFRTTCPVSHQLRDFCQRNPASCKITQIRSVLISGKPSSALRNAFCKAVKDQVFVPSFSGSGLRRTSVNTRSRSTALYLTLGPPPCPGWRDAIPSLLKRSTNCATASPDFLPAICAACV